MSHIFRASTLGKPVRAKRRPMIASTMSVAPAQNIPKLSAIADDKVHEKSPQFGKCYTVPCRSDEEGRRLSAGLSAGR
jgi:hypothetical protein